MLLRYFAYGANIDSTRMTSRVPGVRALGPGRLDGWALEITLRDRDWGGGVLNIRPEPGGRVWGLLWEGPAESFDVLATYQGDASAQRTETVEVNGPEGVVEAMTFRVDRVANHVRPTALYLAHLRRAMRAHEFPNDAFEALIRAEQLGPTETGPSIVS
jgi:hypothetical protein